MKQWYGQLKQGERDHSPDYATVNRVYSRLHYIMTLRKSWLWGSQSNGHEEYNLQDCNMVHFRGSLAFKRDVSPPSSRSSKIPAGNKLNSVCIMFLQHVRLSELQGVTDSACHLLLLVSCLAYSSALKTAVLCSSKTSSSLRPTWHYNPEEERFHTDIDWVIYISNLWVHPTSTLAMETQLVTEMLVFCKTLAWLNAQE
jgi:hypothetical protein